MAFYNPYLNNPYLQPYMPVPQQIPQQIPQQAMDDGYSRRGRYGRNSYNGGNSYEGSYARRSYGRRYSRASGNEEMIEHLERAMEQARTEQERQSIRRMIEQAENG